MRIRTTIISNGVPSYHLHHVDSYSLETTEDGTTVDLTRGGDTIAYFQVSHRDSVIVEVIAE